MGYLDKKIDDLEEVTTSIYAEREELLEKINELDKRATAIEKAISILRVARERGFFDEFKSQED